MKIDVTIIATLRADLLWTTLRSFYNNMFVTAPFGTVFQAFANIDAVGTSGIEETAKPIKFFFDKNHINVSETPSFPNAFKWAWSQVKSPDYVFHLEDDWKLLRTVDIKDMVRIMEGNPKLAVLRLPAFISNESQMKNWNLFYPWNGQYFECPKEYVGRAGFCGHPSLIRSEFVRDCAQLIKPNLNPEKQFHELNTALKSEAVKWEYGVYGRPNEKAYIHDIGRRWMIINNFRKAGRKAWFKTWIKVEAGAA